MHGYFLCRPLFTFDLGKHRKHPYSYGKCLSIIRKHFCLYISVKHNEFLNEDGHRMVENFPLSHAPLDKEPGFSSVKKTPSFTKQRWGIIQ